MRTKSPLKSILVPCALSWCTDKTSSNPCLITVLTDLLLPSGSSLIPFILNGSFFTKVPETCSIFKLVPPDPPPKSVTKNPDAPLDKPSIKLPTGMLVLFADSIVMVVNNCISNKYKSNLVVGPVYDASVFSNV